MEKTRLAKINDCICRIKKEDYSAIEELYFYIANNLRSIAMRYYDNSADIDDEIQDFWMNVPTICKKISIISNGYGYLVKSFENTIRMKLRLKKRSILFIETQYSNRLPIAEDVELSLRQMALRDSFNKAINKMSIEEKTVFLLHCYEDKTIRQIATTVGISKSTAERLSQSAIEKVKSVLIDDGWDSK